MTAQQKEPIAIVGMACRFPGSCDTPSKLWELLKNPYDVLKEFPQDRLNLNRFYHLNGITHGSTDVVNKSYLLDEDTSAFDAKFFSIGPLEAESMDPQQRMLLEAVYEAMESAGWPLEQMHGSLTSVHVGCMNADYTDIQNRDTETISKYNATGTARSILSNRVSYVFDLHGPSVTIDTACSSSLVALHQAVQSLQSGDCDKAIVGGVNLIFDPSMYITESKLSMLSADSQSRMWDQSANGYARGEGIAAVLLKPLSQALRDGDPVQAIVRGTGINSDGHSPGITMPTAAAQAALIKRTYQQAGLDPVKNRCQFFECHGTGTKAGDPVEAQAINDALFSSDSPLDAVPLYVGSIKTVIGHTEGCAGLAGVMKTVLALKHQTIPPNMLFEELNPALKQFYRKLQIPTGAIPWPDVVRGEPKRASVNSFGFGGTNAHAIIEEYLPRAMDQSRDRDVDQSIGPVVVSAHSGPALLSNLRALRQYLLENPSVALSDISWTLQARRTTHGIRIYFNEHSRQALLHSMESFIQRHVDPAAADIGLQTQLINRNEIPGVLGIFTGQGAQWPTMGRGLLARVALFRQSVERCEAVLKALPDGPRWSLREELEAEAKTSRLSEAGVSQPLCTAVQIAIVDVLKAAGVRFHAVIGHSSGEIAAAYTAGILTLPGAMQIAYYRGLHAHLAKGLDGQSGGMIAAGLSYDEAVEFCNREEFRGRLNVAASNSPTSVTLSGDSDAIQDAKNDLDARDVFARPLRVDTAYHSHHMKQCSNAYLDSLLACDIELLPPNTDCIWSSSVRIDKELLRGDFLALKGPYWVQNMEKTVLFTQAIESAITNGGPFDIAIEIGPHPALKSPAEETLKAVFGSAPLYTGVLKRNNDDVEALSAALGSYWAVLGSGSIDFEGYRRACQGDEEDHAAQIIINLPSYSWDHTQTFWRESRISQRYRLGQDAPCELLGRRMPDDSAHELRWRNILTLDEIPWLSGHEILGEVLMPGAGYVSIALEAAQALAAGRSVSLLEVLDMEVRHPVVIPDQQSRVETIFTARVQGSADENILVADFDYSYFPSSSTSSVIRACSGQIVVRLGEPSSGELPPRPIKSADLMDVSVNQAYDVLQSIGLNYQGIFRGMAKISRKSNHATVEAAWPASSLGENFLVHPALLDVVFQSTFMAKSYPARGLVHSAFLPVRIGRVTVNPSVSTMGREDAVAVQVDAFITHQDSRTVLGDMHVYNHAEIPFMEVEGLALKIAGEPQESEDVQIFCETVWKPDTSLELPEPKRYEDHDIEQMELAETIDRVAFFYLRKVLAELEDVALAECQWFHQRMIESFKRTLAQVKLKQHSIIKRQWLDDDSKAVQQMLTKYPRQIDLELIQAIGDNLAAVVRGETQLLEVMLTNDMLGRLYIDGCGFVTINKEINMLLQKITHKFPRAKILEVGAGTGGTTQGILEAIADSYESYTFTDISMGFFEKANERLQAQNKRITFKALDIEKPVAGQGFTEETYDVIIAVNVLHATHDLNNTMQHVRSLLKPGGYLILGEITNTDVLRYSFVMGGLPGWWLGDDEGRHYHPCISVMEWDHLLHETGFSGLDLTFNDLEREERHCNSMLVSRALNTRLEQIREPLAAIHHIPAEKPLLVIGGTSLPVLKARNEIQKLLPFAWRARLTIVNSIDEVDISSLATGTNVICLQELDSPLFSKSVTELRWEKLQALLANAGQVLWFVRNHRYSSPESAMFLGIARSLEQELPSLTLQILDLESRETPIVTARIILETFVRLTLTTGKELSNTNDLLWTHEPEVVISNGQALVPRIMPIQSMNDRYNASRRELIRSDARSTDQVIEVASARRGLALTHVQEPFSELCSDHVRIKVKYSLRIPDVTGQDYYLCSGTTHDSGESVMTLSPMNRSHIQIPRTEAFMLGKVECTPKTFGVVKTFLLASYVAKVAKSRGVILVHEADDMLTQVLSLKISGRVVFSSSRAAVPAGWIHVHPKSSVRAIKNDLPVDIAVYIDCTEGNEHNPNLIKSLPSGCDTYTLDGSLLQQGIALIGLKSLLAEAYASAQEFLTKNQASGAVLPEPIVREVGKIHGSDLSTLQLIDWESLEPLPLTIRPLQPEHLLSPHGTYLMIGLTGAMGMSLCQWAIEHGAKTLVLTSRNPQVDETWLANARRHGADIQVWSMDIADKASVEAVISKIHRDMAPLSGVCNGAMMLSDKLFLDMDLEAMDKVLKPKFKGSQILDEVLGSTPLDFFILLSSCAMLIGNPGQSNYHAGNLYMAGLTAQRRKRGLSASVIHLGYIADVGYVTRQDQSMRERLERLLFRPLSESDIHNAFAEAIQAGKSDNKEGIFDIIMGMGPSKEHVPRERQPYYFSNPRFASFNPPAEEMKERSRQSTTKKNVKCAVEEANSEEEAVECVQISFCAKLESMMQLPPGSIQAQQALMDVGIDSLVAVEIRNWFMKELSVQIPVVKILGGNSIEELCTSATKKVLASILATEQTVSTSDPLGVKQTIYEHSERPLTNSSGASSTGEEDYYTGSSSSIADVVTTDTDSVLDDSTLLEAAVSKPETTKELCELSVPEILREAPFSLAQSRVWFLSTNSETPTVCNLTFHYAVKGPLQIYRLQRALETVMKHHDSLRSCYFMRPGDNQLLQGVMSSPRYLFKHVEHKDAGDVLSESEKFKAQIWNLEKGQVLGMTVVSHNPKEHTIILGYHHIIMDAFSLHIFLRDLDRAYQAGTLEGCLPSYLDYVLDEQRLAEGISNNDELTEELQFWKEEFTTAVDVLPLMPMARVAKRPTRLRNHTSYMSTRIDQTQWAAIVKTCRTLGVTPFHFHLATFQVMLAQYANIEDICIGVADANRLNDTYADTIGFFMNLLPIRSHIYKDADFAQLARSTSRKALAGLCNSGVSFDKILDVVNASRSSGHTPLFQASINYRMGAIGEALLGDCHMTLEDGQDAVNPFDISLGVLEAKNGSALIEIICNADLYDMDGCSILMSTFLRFLNGFAADPTLPVDHCELYDPAAVGAALALGRGTRMDFSATWPTTLSERFVDIAKSHEGKAAIKFRAESLTYSDLWTRMNSIAQSLLVAGCIPGSHVTVLCEPSPDFIACMLAILHVGAVYCPLDVSLPAARHGAIIRRSQSRIILHHPATFERASELGSSTTVLVDVSQVVAVDPTNNGKDVALVQSDPDSPAVLLFTSGSTGEPKGIFLTQGNFLNHIAVKTQMLQLQQEIILQQSSLGFDMSMIQTLSALLNGGQVVIVPSDSRRDPVEIARLIRQEAVTLTIATPSEYQMWLRFGADGHLRYTAGTWRHACLGGEPVSEQLRRDFALLDHRDLILTNCYGPTEITAAATFQSISIQSTNDSADQTLLKVGNALPNYSVSIVDSAGHPLPLGVRGEICIGGASVALGYCDLPEQTEKKFIPDPLRSSKWPFGRSYRTGDQGRLLPDGCLLFMGRLDGDTQVKLHGVRIELEEIEVAILSSSSGRLSVVIATVHEDILLAYATLAPGNTMEENEVEKLLMLASLTLPDYMRPARLIVVDAFPLTSRGKIDRRAIQALPLPAQAVYLNEDLANRDGPPSRMTLREGELRLLWERVLSGPNRSITSESDFFAVGGNSMSLMRLQGAIKESMGVEISTRDLYQASALRLMAARIEAQGEQHQLEGGDETLDWDQETQIPPAIQIILDQLSSSANDEHGILKKKNGMQVLLTGATSFLGGTILKALTKLLGSRVRKIYCIAVLPDEKKAVPASDSIVYYTGSLLSRRLGLAASEHDYLKSNVDLIIHAGANGHCLNNYYSLRVPNLQSTHQLAALALTRSIPIHYLSSNRVTLLSGKTAYPPLSIASSSPPADGSEGYTASKWASEVFLERLVKTSPQQRLAVQISRPCVVVGTEAPNSDALNAILRYSRLMQTVPIFENVEGYFDFKDVEEVAQEVVRDALALVEDSRQLAGLQFRHHSGGVPVSLARFRERMEEIHGVPFGECSLTEWINRALQVGIDPLITAYLEGMVERGDILRFPYMGEEL